MKKYCDNCKHRNANREPCDTCIDFEKWERADGAGSRATSEKEARPMMLCSCHGGPHTDGTCIDDASRVCRYLSFWLHPDQSWPIAGKFPDSETAAAASCGEDNEAIQHLHDEYGATIRSLEGALVAQQEAARYFADQASTAQAALAAVRRTADDALRR